jgi:carnitine O-acetyltransferase
LDLSPKNKKSLDKIERAAFAVCLDDTSPVTREESSRACWHGDGQNRFFDKSLQFIVFENGKAGFNGEHSMMDATPTHRLCDFILEGLKNKTMDLGTSTVGSIPQPEKLEFELDSGLEKSIDVAIKKFNDLIKTQDVKVTVFEEYGKNHIKKMKLSPDGYAQMAIQLAYFKTYGKCVPTYESAQTRKFGFGRTETCRSCTTESVEWVKAMQNPNLSLKIKGELGRKAIHAQTSYMAKAVEGKGVDRHLLGLRLLLKPEEQKPTLFTDPMYAATCHWKLSTSQISSEHFDGYGWGEVVSDGYGIAYMVKNNSLHFNLACQWLGADRLRDNFMQALREMRQVFEATIPEPKSKL